MLGHFAQHSWSKGIPSDTISSQPGLSVFLGDKEEPRLPCQFTVKALFFFVQKLFLPKIGVKSFWYIPSGPWDVRAALKKTRPIKAQSWIQSSSPPKRWVKKTPKLHSPCFSFGTPNLLPSHLCELHCDLATCWKPQVLKKLQSDASLSSGKKLHPYFIAFYNPHLKLGSFSSPPPPKKTSLGPTNKHLLLFFKQNLHSPTCLKGQAFSRLRGFLGAKTHWHAHLLWHWKSYSVAALRNFAAWNRLSHAVKACKNAWGNTGAELPLPKPWRCFKLEASQVPGYYGLKTALSVLETKFSGTKKLPQKRAEQLLSKAQCLQRSGDSAVKSWPHWHNFPSWKLPFQGKLGPDAKNRWVRKPGLEIAKALGRVYWLYHYFGGFLCTKHMGSR